MSKFFVVDLRVVWFSFVSSFVWCDIASVVVEYFTKIGSSATDGQ